MRALARSTPNFSQVSLDSNNTPASLEITGLGLHSGRCFRLSLVKTQNQKGLLFQAKLGDVLCVAPALWTRLSGTTRSTALVLRGPQAKVELRTVEHLLAALYVLGLQNFEMNIEEVSATKVSDGSAGPADVFEIPVLDGSSADWMKWLWDLAKSESQATEELKVYRVVKDYRFEDGDRSVEFKALEADATQLKLDVHVDFGPQLKQHSQYIHDWANPTPSRQNFLKNFAPARTFGFQHEILALKERGLALGGSLDNAILIDGSRVINEGGFRVPNELAAHKLVDAVGDFSLIGQSLIASITCIKAGHYLHIRALKEAFDQGVFEASTLRIPR